MAERALPADVAALVAKRLTCMDDVEVLLALRRASAPGLSATELAREVASDLRTVTEAATRLRRAGLVATDETTEPPTYRYQPTSIPLHAAVENLAVAYDEQPVALAKAVYDRRTTTLRAFADAFRLR